METEKPYCDNGCGRQATFQCNDVGLCDVCLAEIARDDLQPLMGRRICARVLSHANGTRSLCLETYGQEHDHDS